MRTQKTQASYLTISIDDMLTEELRAHKKRQMDNKMRFGKSYYDSTYQRERRASNT